MPGNPHSKDELHLPREPIDRVIGPLAQFLHIQAAGGVVLLASTCVALAMANSPWAESYLDFWKTPLSLRLGGFDFTHSLQHIINDGLMAIFFFVIGLEVKREIVHGELSDPRQAALPIAAALGGMVVPAAIYLALQWGEPGQRGWGIPMATDIAFVVGCMAVLGSRVPRSLRVMLISLAIADDIGAILIIAIGYTRELHTDWLWTGVLGIAVVTVLARLGFRSLAVYAAAGAVVWYAFHESGVHATIAGVILGLMTPARSYLSTSFFGRVLRRADALFHGNWEAEAHRAQKVRWLRRASRETISPLEYLEHTLHPWVSFAIMPLFALANAGVPIRFADLGSSLAIAVMLGLVVGKPVGILLASWLAVRLGIARLPEGVTWRMIAGAGCLAGIGFTMALFIAGLAVEGKLLDTAKIGILAASVVSAILGMAVIVASQRPGE